MPLSAELVQAKQTLSARLLRRGLQGHAVSMVPTLSVRAAVASAGRNVHAVGVGRKIVEGTVTETAAVRLYVAQKIAPSLLPPRDRLPQTIDGIPTDVIEAAPAFLTAVAPTCTTNRRRAQRPLVAGISAAHVDVTAGTIAYFCRSLRHGDDPTRVYVLSNNHVFAQVNQGRSGDDLYQPGPLDDAADDDHFAALQRFTPITLGGTTPNQVDAAIGLLLPGVAFHAEVCHIGRITGTGRAVEEMQVCKHGRTTGFTEGKVTDELYDALVGMDHNDPSVVALFENQMRLEVTPPYTAIGLGGDSGSLVVNRAQAEAVGLYFAGPPDGSYGVANHIADVLAALQIELL